jgi:hypothetical protein
MPNGFDFDSAPLWSAGDSVMAGLVPAIHVFFYEGKAWMTVTSTAMTTTACERSLMTYNDFRSRARRARA